MKADHQVDKTFYSASGTERLEQQYSVCKIPVSWEGDAWAARLLNSECSGCVRSLQCC